MKKSRQAQAKLNERNSRMRLQNKMNANFGPGCILYTPTLPDDLQPENYEGALAILKWLLAKLRDMCRKLGTELKYIWVMEQTTDPERGTRYHFHMTLATTNDRIRLDVEAVKKIWWDRFGDVICHAERYQKNRDHLKGWASYMRLDKPRQTVASKRSWNGSRNLIEPPTRISDHKISRRRAQLIAGGFETDAKEVLEKAFPGYELLDRDSVRVRSSEYAQGVYIYATMRKREGARSRGIRTGEPGKAVSA